MTVDPKRVQAAFLAAVAEPDPAARAAVLDRECGADAALRERVAALLRAHDTPDSFLDDPDHTQTAGDPVDAADPTPLGFLQPSTKPGALGRLAHYEVLEVLGAGGFGTVLRAFDEKLHRVVAIKVMAAAMAATSPARKRFLREARAAARVRHPHVVDIHAVEEQPLPYLVMEYVAGETLQQRLDRVGPLEVPEVARVGRQIAEGLAAAHAQGLIHRDVKPANILLEAGPEASVKLTDFGLARAADDASLTQSGVIAGTPLYMAPEQAEGLALDQRADLFSLGSVLYTMVSGRPPFRAPTTLGVLKRVCEDTPRPIREVIPEAPAWLCDLIARLHAKKPEDRLQTAAEVAALLAHPPSGPVPRGAAGLPARRAPVGPRRRAVAVAAVGLAVLLAALLGLTEATGLTRLTAVALQTPRPGGMTGSTPPPVPLEALTGAVLVMTFEREAFYQKDGTTWVRDLSGRGNDARLVNAAYTPAGRVGGGLSLDGTGHLRLAPSLVEGQPNFTIAAWFRRDGPAEFRAFATVRADGLPEQKHRGVVIPVTPGADVSVETGPDRFDLEPVYPNGPPPELFKTGEWFLLTLRVQRSGSGSVCQLTVNDYAKVHGLDTADGSDPAYHDEFAHRLKGAVDELAVWQRALSNEELLQLSRAGTAGRTLATAPRGFY